MNEISKLLTVGDTPALAEWVTALRSGEYLQTVSMLKKTLDPGAPSEYCCLGVLLEISAKTNEALTSHPQEFHIDDLSYDMLPPRAALPALGIEVEYPCSTFNVRIAFPEDMRFWYRDADDDEVVVNPNPEYISATELNDELMLTFDQIADLVEYFGVFITE